MTTLDYIGDPDGFPILRDFLLRRFQGEIDSPTFDVMLSIIVYMGPLAARSDSAFQFLASGTDPNYWSSIPWTHQNLKGRHLQLLWSKLAINALSWSGRAEVVSILERLAKAPYDQQQIGNIEQGFKLQREVAAVGIDKYCETYEEHDVDPSPPGH